MAVKTKLESVSSLISVLFDISGFGSNHFCWAKLNQRTHSSPHPTKRKQLQLELARTPTRTTQFQNSFYSINLFLQIFLQLYNELYK
jgi:hypothetical protein